MYLYGIGLIKQTANSSVADWCLFTERWLYVFFQKPSLDTSKISILNDTVYALKVSKLSCFRSVPWPLAQFAPAPPPPADLLRAHPHSHTRTALLWPVTKLRKFKVVYLSLWLWMHRDKNMDDAYMVKIWYCRVLRPAPLTKKIVSSVRIEHYPNQLTSSLVS